MVGRELAEHHRLQERVVASARAIRRGSGVRGSGRVLDRGTGFPPRSRRTCKCRPRDRNACSAGENWWGLPDMQGSIAAGASDLVMLDAMKIGGVTGWLRAAGLAAAHGLPVSSHLFSRSEPAPAHRLSDCGLARMAGLGGPNPQGADPPGRGQGHAADEARPRPRMGRAGCHPLRRVIASRV